MPSPCPTDPDLVPPAAELLLKAIVESSDDAILSKNLEGIVTSWNQSAERIFGYPREEMIGRSVTLLLPPDRLAEEASILDQIRRGERVDHFETVRRRKDGRLIDMSVTISPIRDQGGEIIGASNVARDITGQKRDAGSAQLLAAIVNSSEDAIISKNLDGIITSWNTAARHIFGYAPEEIVGQSVLQLVPEDRRDEEPKILERLHRGERVEHFETIRMRKNGEQFPVSLTISPVRDTAGNIVGASKIARDITHLKRIGGDLEQLLASERLARAQAEHANRMKDEFLATISHELRTPLGAIVGWTQVLKESLDRPEDLAAGIETIERNAYLQAQLIEDLLDLGRIVSGKMALDAEPVELGSVITHAIAAVKHLADLKEIS
ncbi:MAG TPA: PAS domain S-box protein, partial [Candidatus Limnocylindria bacterium]|nr:PAS domain S-box protein [Candidatus Limnocylindria bacterium]